MSDGPKLVRVHVPSAAYQVALRLPVVARRFEQINTEMSSMGLNGYLVEQLTHTVCLRLLARYTPPKLQWVELPEGIANALGRF